MMKTTLRGIYALLLLMAGGVVQAQQQPTDTLFESFGIGIVLAVVGLMILTLGIFIRQLWQQAKQTKVEALTDKVQSVSAISPAASPPAREGHGTALYIPVPPELEDAPTMLLELVNAPSGGRLQAGQQWFINQNRTPFVMGSGTDENQALDILLPNNFVSSFHLKIEFEPLKQRFVVIDTDSLNGTSFNDVKMQANTRYPIPADKSAMIEVAHQYVFKMQQVKGKPVIGPQEETKATPVNQAVAQANSSLPQLNLGEVGVTEPVEPITVQSDFVATSKLPDVSELMDNLPEYAVTAEVATLAEAPDMSNIVGVRYPLHNVEYPPLARLPADIDAMIEVLKSPQAEPATYTIWRTVYHVGRGDKTDLRLPGAMISNNHFSIYWAKDSFWIIDTSLNQTWLRWADTETVLERGSPVKLEIGRDYQLVLAREDTMLRFRYVKSEVNSDANEITLPPLPVSIRPTLTMVRIGSTDERKEFNVTNNRITIGRESTNVVQLDPQVISRRHAELVWKADAYYLQDKGSLYGVMVDDIPLQSGGEKRLEVGKKHRIVLSPKQRDAVHLEFFYADKRVGTSD